MQEPEEPRNVYRRGGCGARLEQNEEGRHWHRRMDVLCSFSLPFSFVFHLSLANLWQNVFWMCVASILSVSGSLSTAVSGEER